MSQDIPSRNSPDTAEIACTLTDSELVERREKMRRDFIPYIESIEEMDDGYAFTVDGSDEALVGVMDFVRNEHRCCAHAEFELTVTPREEPIRLTMTGPEGTKEMTEEGFVRPVVEEFEIPLVS